MSSTQISPVFQHAVSIHVVPPKVDRLIQIVDYCGPSASNLLIITRQSDTNLATLYARLPSCTTVILQDETNIGAMISALAPHFRAIFAQEKQTSRKSVLIDLTNANRFLVHTILLLTWHTATDPNAAVFTYFDFTRNRVQYTSISKVFPDLALPSDEPQIEVETEQTPGATNIEQSAHEKEQPPVSTTKQAIVSANVQAAPSTQVKKNNKEETILKRRELVESLWKYRRVILESITGHVSVNKEKQKGYEGKRLCDFFQCQIKLPENAVVYRKNETGGICVITDAANARVQFYTKEGVSRACYNGKLYQDVNIWQYLGGQWFEEFVYLQLYELQKRGLLDTIECNVKPKSNSWELDLVAHSSKRTFIIECKTNYNSNHQKTVETLSSRAQLASVSGVDCIGVMVYLRPIEQNSAVLQKIKGASNVALLSGDNLEKLIRERLIGIKPGETLS